MEDRSPEHDRSLDHADMHSLTNFMGNVTDTMKKSLKSFLRLSVALVIMAGLSTGAAMGQNVFNVQGGGQYDRTEFQPALNDAALNGGGTIEVINETTIDLNSQSNLRQYTTSSGGNRITIRAATGSANENVQISLDAGLNIGNDAIELDGTGSRGVNIEFPENDFSLVANGRTGPTVEVRSTTSSEDANRLLFSGDTGIEDTEQARQNEISIDRVSIQGGPVEVASNNSGVGADDLTIREFLDVGAELDLGKNNLNFRQSAGGPPVNVDLGPGGRGELVDLNISGTITNGNRFDINLTSDSGGRYTIEGNGDLEVPVTYQTNIVRRPVLPPTIQLAETVFEQTAIGQFGFSNFGRAGPANNVYFPFLVTARASFRIQGGNTNVEFGDPFPNPNVAPRNQFPNSSTSLTLGAPGTSTSTPQIEVASGATVETAPDLALTVEGDFDLSGGGSTVDIPTDLAPGGGTVPFPAGPTDRPDAVAETPVTFNGDVTVNAGNLNLRAPGTIEGETKSEINGALDLGGGTPGGTLLLEDETSTNTTPTPNERDGNGLQNLAINGDFTFDGGSLNNDGNNDPFGSEPDPKVSFEGSSNQDIDIQAGPLNIERLIVEKATGTDANVSNGTLAITERGAGSTPTETLDLEDGDLTTNGNLDASNADLTRVKTASGNGRLVSGNAPIAYTGTTGGDGNGNTALNVPDRVEYNGERSISTGDELIASSQDAVDRQIDELAVALSEFDEEVFLNQSYTINSGGSLEVTGGDLDLGASTVTLEGNVTVVRGDGAFDGDPQDLQFPTVASNQVGNQGIDLEYSNEAEDIQAGIEFPDTGRDANVIRDLTLTDPDGDQDDDGRAAVALAGDATYRVNDDLNLNEGVLDVNGQTLEHNGSATSNSASGSITYDSDAGLTDSGDGGLFRFVGGQEQSGAGPNTTVQTVVTANADQQDGTTFTFPETEVDKGDRAYVDFQVNDNNAGGPTDPDDRFKFEGDLTMTAAQTYDGQGDGDNINRQNDGVQFTQLAGGGGADDTDRIVIDGDLVQNAGSFGANAPNTNASTLTRIEVGGDLTKDASSESRFIADATRFRVGGNLTQGSGTFRVDGGSIFTVGGDLVNNSPDDLNFVTPSFSSEAFEVNERTRNFGSGARFEVTGTVTQTAGIFEINGYNGRNPDGRVEVEGSFDHQDGVTDIPQAIDVSVTNDVTVTSGSFSANLNNNTTTANNNPIENTFDIGGALTVGDGTDPSAGGDPFTSGQDATLDFASSATTPGNADSDVISIDGETSVRYDAQLQLVGHELQQSGDFELLGAGDNLMENNAPEESGLAGTVRFVGEQDQTNQAVETDETADTYFNGFVAATEGNVDVELNSNVTTNRLDNASPRPFGFLSLQRGNVVAEEDSFTVLEPRPTGGDDLDQAINADEQGPAGVVRSPVLGGTVNSHVVGALRRAVEQDVATTGGFVEDGYVFPVGTGEEYDALVITPRGDLGSSQFYTVSLAGDPGIDLPADLTSDGFDRRAGEEIELDLNVQTGPYFRVESEGAPLDNFDVRAIAGDLGRQEVSEVKQLRIVQFDTTAQSAQEAGLYDIDTDPSDDARGGANAFLRGAPNVHHEGVDFSEGMVLGLASDSEYNPGLQDQPNQVTIAGQVTYAGNAGIGGVDVTATSGDTSATTTTDADGNYSFPGLTPGSYEVTTSVSGEPQGINATDALLAVQFFAGSASLSDFQQELADVNDSGDVNATDALLIAQFASGNVSSFEAGTFASTSDSTDASTDASDVDLEVAAYGDVNLSGGVGSSSSQPALSVTKAEGVSVSTSAKTAGASAAPGEDAISVPVSLDRSAELGAYTLSIEYPAETVSFEGVSSEDVLARDADGTVHLAWFDRSGEQPLSLNAGDAFVTLRFTPAEGAEDGSLKIENVKGELAGADATTLSGVGLQVPEVGLGGPESFAFDGNYPNPVGQRTTISFDLPEQANVSLEVYDVLGRKVMTIPKQSMSAGADRSLSVDASGLSSGTYLYRLQVEMGDQTIRETDQMNVVR